MKSNFEPIQLKSSIPPSWAGIRLDVALAQLFPEYSRNCLQNWIRAKQVKVNDTFLKPKAKVVGGETITIEAVLPIKGDWHAQALPLSIVYEDNDMIIINKPVGVVTHPAAGNPDHTLANALLYHHPALSVLPRAGLIHRLDKGTSGLLIIAKTLSAYTALLKQMQQRQIKREYQALVRGNITGGGKVDAPIGRHPRLRKQMAIVNGGKAAITHYRIVERFRQHTLIRLDLETGRTHQIRVHMASIHHPIVGDPIYGGRMVIPSKAAHALQQALQGFAHQALHAVRLSLSHPITGEPLVCNAPLPADFNHLVELLCYDKQTHG